MNRGFSNSNWATWNSFLSEVTKILALESQAEAS